MIPVPPDPQVANAPSKRLSIFRRRLASFATTPHFYNTFTAIVSGLLFLPWLIATLRSPRTLDFSLLSLAAIAPITMLAIYHRAYDARLLMLTVPACALLFAEKRITGKIALLITALGLIFTGELSYGLLKVLTPNLRPAYCRTARQR